MRPGIIEEQSIVPGALMKLVYGILAVATLTGTVAKADLTDKFNQMAAQLEKQKAEDSEQMIKRRKELPALQILNTLASEKLLSMDLATVGSSSNQLKFQSEVTRICDKAKDNDPDSIKEQRMDFTVELKDGRVCRFTYGIDSKGFLLPTIPGGCGTAEGLLSNAYSGMPETSRSITLSCNSISNGKLTESVVPLTIGANEPLTAIVSQK